MLLHLSPKPHDLSSWKLIISGAAIMFLGQIVLGILGYFALGAVPSSTSTNPLDEYSGISLYVAGVLVIPFIETFIGQWLPIRAVRLIPKASWAMAGLVSAILFTVVHGYTDRFTVNIFLGAAVLATVFVIEAKRNGRPIQTTYLTHALSNLLVFGFQALNGSPAQG